MIDPQRWIHLDMLTNIIFPHFQKGGSHFFLEQLDEPFAHCPDLFAMQSVVRASSTLCQVTRRVAGSQDLIEDFCPGTIAASAPSFLYVWKEETALIH